MSRPPSTYWVTHLISRSLPTLHVSPSPAFSLFLFCKHLPFSIAVSVVSVSFFLAACCVFLLFIPTPAHFVLSVVVSWHANGANASVSIFPPKKRCCPYEGGVCCPNGMTCCPKGSTCQDDHWASTCIGAPKEETGGLPICKPGAPLPFSKTLHNVVIIGDSVSIGYTPKVTAHMASTALVQHSPYDVRDGGAEETAYGVECAFCSSLFQGYYTTFLCLYYPEMHCFTALCAIYTPFLQFRFKIFNSKVLIT